MTRICELTGKKPAVANNVSHSQRKTKRRQLPNLQERSFFSDLLGRKISLRLSTNAIRTIDKHEGIDNFIGRAKANLAAKFSDNALKLRKEMRKILKSQEAK